MFFPHVFQRRSYLCCWLAATFSCGKLSKLVAWKSHTFESGVGPAQHRTVRTLPRAKQAGANGYAPAPNSFYRLLRHFPLQLAPIFPSLPYHVVIRVRRGDHRLLCR